MARSPAGIFACCMAILAIAPVAKAEREFEYGMALYSTFGFRDLAETFFSDLEQRGTGPLALSGTLGRGAILAERAKAAEREGRSEEARALNEQALEFLDRFARQAQSDHPERSHGITRLSEIRKEIAFQLIRQARAMPDRAARERQIEAARKMLQDLVRPLEEQAAGARAALVKHIAERGEATSQADRKRREELVNDAVLSMQLMYLMKADLAETYEPGSRERKIFVEETAGAIDRDSEFWEAEGYDPVMLWLFHMMGRTWAVGGDKERAYRAFDLLINYDSGFLTGQVAAYVNDLKMVAFYLKSKFAFEIKDYPIVIRTVEHMLTPMMGLGPQALSDDRGNAALLFRAEAHLLNDPPEYEKALADCLRVIQRNHGGWANNARQLSARIRAAIGDRVVQLSPEVLYNIAMGDFQLALRERDRDARLPIYERAIRGFQDAIVACRAPGTTYLDRLSYEPTSWFEMAICYSNIGKWYEAGFAFEAALRFFAKDMVGRRIAEMRDFQEMFAKIQADIASGAIKPAEGEAAVDPYVAIFDHAAQNSRLAARLKAIEERLTKSANNLLVAAGRRRSQTRWAFDSDLYNQALITLINVDPLKRPEVDFHMAAIRSSEADTLFNQNKAAEAIAAWEEAGKRFLKAAQEVPTRRRDAYRLGGRAFFRAMTEAQKLSERDATMGARTTEYARTSLDAFRSFLTEARRDLEKTYDRAQISSLERTIEEALVQIPSVLLTLGSYDETVSAADEYLALESKNEDYARSVIWTRFMALRHAAIAAAGTDAMADRFKTLTAAAEELRSGIGARYYGTACSAVSAAYTEAANRLEALARETPDSAAGLLAEVDPYRLQSAEWMRRVIDLHPERQKDLGFMAGIATVFYRQKAYEGARDLYLRIITEHDPKGEGMREHIDANSFAEAKRLTVFDRRDVMERVRADIDKLQVLVLGGPVEQRGGRRPDPRSQRDWFVAARAIDRLLEIYPDIGSRAQLEAIRNELTFRLQILTVRLNLSDCSSALARRAATPDQAKAYWQEAAELLAKVRDYHYRDNELRILHAEALEALGQLQDALALLSEAGRAAPEGSPESYRAQIAYSRVALSMADAATDPARKKQLYQSAMSFPDNVVRLVPEEEWRRYYPDAKDFIANVETKLRELGWQEREGASAEVVVDYAAAPSEFDLELRRQLVAIDQRIRLGEVPAERLLQEQQEAFRRHLRELSRKAHDDPDSVGRNRAEVDADRRILIFNLLYLPPVTQPALARQGVELGILEDTTGGMPIGLMVPQARRKAIEFELLTEAGERRPISELPDDLRRRIRVTAPPAEEAGAAQPAAQPVAAEEVAQ